MRARWLHWVVAVALCATATTACTRGADEPEASPGASATATPSPTPTPTPTQPPAEPFELTQEDAFMYSMSNNGVFGAERPEPDVAAAEAAAEDVVSLVRDYLDAVFVSPATRFTAEPLDALMSPTVLAALTDEDREALGALDLQVERTETGEATAKPRVLIDGSTVHSVTITFDAGLTAVTADGETPLRQRGTLVFFPSDGGWQVIGLDVVLQTPDSERSGEAGEESPSPSETDPQDSE
ncbi:MAG TPA: hypothetical protein VML96_04735 [Egibacteraceae bacterium]|nr:hypothetical protein [Egibacteraceae bacterium]